MDNNLFLELVISSQCKYFAYSLPFIHLYIQQCDYHPQPHLWEFHLLHSKRVLCRRPPKCKQVFDLFIEGTIDSEILHLITYSTLLTGLKSLFRFQVLLHGLWAVFAHSGWRSEESQSQHCCHVSCDIHSSRVWPVVGTDDSRSSSDDNVVDVWSYVSVEYTIKCIISCQSSHG